MTKNGANGRVTEKNDGDQSKREWSYSMAISGCRVRPWAGSAENPGLACLRKNTTPPVNGA